MTMEDRSFSAKSDIFITPNDGLVQKDDFSF